ncbi:MAG: hypothetical protein K6F27_02610, partial [Ruminococcus sp.]|nr:hypothetical protein [Ruminococcus sp.]
DDDGLYDNVEISKDGWCSKEGTDHFGNTVWKRYYSMNSDPTKQDSDGDGLDDLKETNGFYYESINGKQKHCVGDPIHKGINGGYCGELAIISCTNGLGGHAFLVYHSFIDDTLDFRGFTKGYDYTTWLPSEPRLYEIKTFEYVALGNAGNNATASSFHSQLSEFESTGDDGDDAGAYFNREFTHEKHNYDDNYDKNYPEEFKQEYDENYAISTLVKKKQIDSVIAVFNENNWYNLTRNNCAHVAAKAWNSIMGEDYFTVKKLGSGDILDSYDYFISFLFPYPGISITLDKIIYEVSPEFLKNQICKSPNRFVFDMYRILGLELV